MPLSPGQSVGPYRVVEKIGEGDGGRVIAAEQSSMQINVIQNFLTELRQRVK